jgi:hypothetical protein
MKLEKFCAFQNRAIEYEEASYMGKWEGFKDWCDENGIFLMGTTENN